MRRVKTDDPSQQPIATEKSRPAAGDYEITIYDAWCKRCGICAEFCPKGVLACDPLGMPVPTRQELCIGCTQCVLHCPDFAITCSVKKKPEEQNG